jgi:hypothetical protein
MPPAIITLYDEPIGGGYVPSQTVRIKNREQLWQGLR